MNRRNFLKSLSATAAFLPFFSGCSTRKKKPNIVFFLVDDLGWRDLGCFGSTFYETPNVDRLCAEGMKFTNAYAACPVCSPTRASIMTGKYPARLHITDWIPGRQASSRANEPANKLVPPDFQLFMKLEEVTLGEAMKEAGYTTGFFGKWHLGQEDKYWPEHQGFDVNKGGHSKGSPPGGYFSPYKNPRLEDGPPGEYLTDRLGDETVSFIKAKKDEPFFAYLSFYTVHNPMQGKKDKIEKYRQKAERLGLLDQPQFNENPEWAKNVGRGNWKERLVQSYADYAAMVEAMDDNVGKVMNALDELGLADNTIVFFMADNGGLSTSEGSPTTNAPLRAGKGWLYEGGIREPMIVKWPGVVAPGSQCDWPVISNDFYPTILEMLNRPLKPEQHMDGVSLVPLLKGRPNLDRDELYWHYPHYSNQGGKPGGVIRKGNFKLIERYETGQLELYNLKEDISEKNDLAAQMPEKAQELLTLLRKWREKVDAQMPAPVN